MNPPPHQPGYAALRRFRHALSGAEYFVTTNLLVRGSGLEAEVLRNEIQNQWLKLQNEQLWQVRTAVVMPDHVHLLLNLGSGGSLADCIRLFKGRLSPKLRAHRLQWQDGYYEHEVREAEDLLPVFLYIYLNPYRANLIPLDQQWPGYYCREEDWSWFGRLTDRDLPPSEWLR